ncbi:IS5 family transposase [Acuticoccus sp. M5D2P5]|uniref:IS5 family transposase n=1 Tax=Acuticoccus kalidii TaxID=2910977 RepID=UPI001F20D6AE|nr:IS5 family transposase [Acuticoccus kalidii]
MARYDLSEVEWSIIEPLLPPSLPGKQRVDDRCILTGIFWILRTGSPWRDLPARYAPARTVYNRFNRWAKRGVWLAVFEALARDEPAALQLIDSSIVKASARRWRKKGGQWIPHRQVMRDPPAWEVLGLRELKILFRLEVEHMRHGGTHNGRLKVSYTKMTEAGAKRRQGIPRALPAWSCSGSSRSREGLDVAAAGTKA